MWRLFIVCAMTVFPYGKAGGALELVQLMKDPGFEDTQPGSLESIASSARMGSPTRRSPDNRGEPHLRMCCRQNAGTLR